MSKIFYEQFRDRYVISGCEATPSDTVTLILDTPIDASIIINGSVVISVEDGKAEIKRSRLKDAKCHPTLYLSDKYMRLEPFILTDGGVSTYGGEEYVRELSRELSEIKSKVGDLARRIELCEGRIGDSKIF